jgi:cAMP-dependent protein kinase regulator
MFMYSAHDYVLRVLTFTHLSLSLGMCVIGFFCTVFGESYDPSAAQEPVEKVVYPKSDEQRARLKSVMKGIFLFRALETEQENEVLDGIFERKVQPNDHIIDQGDDGDNFYVIDSGKYDIYVAASGEEPKLVGNYDNEGSFGELALMYNTPRAATIVATTEGVLWALDRKTFRRIICDAASRKRQTYHDLLESVPMLAQLEVCVTACHGSRYFDTSDICRLIQFCRQGLDFPWGSMSTSIF